MSFLKRDKNFGKAIMFSIQQRFYVENTKQALGWDSKDSCMLKIWNGFNAFCKQTLQIFESFLLMVRLTIPMWRCRQPTLIWAMCALDWLSLPVKLVPSYLGRVSGGTSPVASLGVPSLHTLPLTLTSHLTTHDHHHSSFNGYWVTYRRNQHL